MLYHTIPLLSLQDNLHLKQIMRVTQDQMTQILNAESNVVSKVGSLDLTLFDSLVGGWCFFCLLANIPFHSSLWYAVLMFIWRWHSSFTYCFDCCQSYEKKKKKKPSTLTILQRNRHKFCLFGCALFMPTLKFIVRRYKYFSFASLLP